MSDPAPKIEDRAHAAKLLLDSVDQDEQYPDAEVLRAAELTRRAQAVADGMRSK